MRPRAAALPAAFLALFRQVADVWVMGSTSVPGTGVQFQSRPGAAEITRHFSRPSWDSGSSSSGFPALKVLGYSHGIPPGCRSPRPPSDWRKPPPRTRRYQKTVCPLPRKTPKSRIVKMTIKGERARHPARLHIGETFAIDPTDGLVRELGKPRQRSAGNVGVLPTDGKCRAFQNLASNAGGIGKVRPPPQQGERFGQDTATGDQPPATGRWR